MELQSGSTYVFKYKDNIFQVNSTNDEKDNQETSNAESNDENVNQDTSNKTTNKDLKFTATVIDILTNDDGYRTLRVENKIIENNKIPGMVIMPYNWIESAVLLDAWTK